MSMKDKLLDLLQREYETEQTFINNVTEADRAAGTAEQWSPRDMFAHVLTWKTRMADVLEAAARGDTPVKIEGTTDEVNAAFFEATRHKSWDTLVAEARNLHGRAVASVEALSEEALTDPNYRPWMNNSPLWQRMNGNCLTHAMLHFAEFYYKQGQRERATSVLEDTTLALLDLSDTSNWRGQTIYNLACGYALTGQKDKAINSLEEAFRLSPGIIEWSKEDPDLNSIREEPGFQALYKTA